MRLGMPLIWYDEVKEMIKECGVLGSMSMKYKHFPTGC